LENAWKTTDSGFDAQAEDLAKIFRTLIHASDKSFAPIIAAL